MCRTCYSDTLFSAVFLWYVNGELQDKFTRKLKLLANYKIKRGQVCLSFACLTAKMLSALGGFTPDHGISAKPQTPIISSGSALPASPHYLPGSLRPWCLYIANVTDVRRGGVAAGVRSPRQISPDPVSSPAVWSPAPCRSYLPTNHALRCRLRSE